jgi:Domain of unknown function (DUF222)/HNH endonuclease
MDGTARNSFDALLRRLDEDHARLSAASAALLQTIAELEESDSWSEDDETSLSCFLAARLGLRAATARELVRVARKLRSLPAIASAHASGVLSWDQLRPVTRFATEETDEQLSIEAPQRSVAQLYRDAARHEVDRRKRIESDHQVRSMRMGWDEERRFLNFEGSLPGEQGARFEAAVRYRAEQIEADAEAIDPHGARLADAVTDLASSSEDSAAPATLVVHADAQVVTGRVEPGPRHLAETESGVQLSSDAVRRLACDAKIEWVLEADGRPVGIGRRGRMARGALRRAVLHRDGGMCSVPGCERRSWLDAHHLVHWADGGPTNLDNLVTLCSAHHRRIHEGGWHATGIPGRGLRFHDPGGRALSRAGPTAA